MSEDIAIRVNGLKKNLEKLSAYFNGQLTEGDFVDGNSDIELSENFNEYVQSLFEEGRTLMHDHFNATMMRYVELELMVKESDAWNDEEKARLLKRFEASQNEIIKEINRVNEMVNSCTI